MEQRTDLKFDIGHVLFIDIVGYSKLLITEQTNQLQTLREIVRGREQFRIAEAEGKLLRLPTGDGGALVFRNNSEAPVLCALDISKALKSHPELKVRMGIHSGPVNEITDLNEQANIAGAGINIAQRVMDCGDAGHILLSRHVAEDLEHYPRWQPYLHSLGECEVKHGVRIGIANLFDSEVGNPQLPKKLEAVKRHRTQMRWTEVAITLVVLAAIIVGVVFLMRRPARSAMAIVDKSIAVLPFENLSDEKANAYFAEGMQDEILTRLSKIASLKVISRTSTQHYASKPANMLTVGRELGVANILEGSVQKAGELVHINVQLIRSATDEHLWAESYDRDFKNVFDIEREIAEAVAGKLSAVLLPHEADELARVPTTNAQAYDLYLRAKYIAYQYWNGQVDSDQPAVDLFQQATGLDPNFAEAYVGAGQALVRMYLGGEKRSDSQLEQGKAYAEKALALQPALAPARMLLARIWQTKGDIVRAASEYESLEKLAPNNADILCAISGFKSHRGDKEGALQGMRRVVELDPRNEVYVRWLGDAYRFLRRNGEAQEVYQRGCALAPDDWVMRANSADNLARLGRFPEAIKDVTSWPEEKLGQTGLGLKYSTLSYLELLSHNYQDALVAAQKVPLTGDRIAASGTLPFSDIKRNTDIGFCYLYLGDSAHAREAFLAARKGLEPQLAAHADDLDLLLAASDVAVGLGEFENALAVTKRAVDLAPKERDFDEWTDAQESLAQVYARFGKAAEAVTILRQLFYTPGTGDAADPIEMQLSPTWDPIRKTPEFQKLLLDHPPPSL